LLLLSFRLIALVFVFLFEAFVFKKECCASLELHCNPFSTLQGLNLALASSWVYVGHLMSKAYNQVLNLTPHEYPSKMNLPVKVINLDLDKTQFSSLENSSAPKA